MQTVLILFTIIGLMGTFKIYFRSLEIDNFKQIYNMSLKEKKQKVLLTGGSGFIGSKIAQALIDDGHEVSILTRNFKTTIEKFSKRVRLLNSLEDDETNYDIIINLAGAAINQRWTKESKEVILKSRIDISQELVNYIKRIDKKPKLLISSSGTGIYKASEEVAFTELSSLADSSFTAEVCKDWEAKALEAKAYGVRVVPLRTGLVLATDGGMLAEMLTAFDLCLGGKLGTGKQMMPWIDMHDLLGIVQYVINNKSLKSVVNATAPKPVSNLEFSQTLAKAMRRPMFLTTPLFVLELFYGKEMVRELLLKGRSVLPMRVQEHGYEFQFATLEQSMNNLFKRKET